MLVWFNKVGYPAGMWSFACSHGAEVGVIDGLVWFFSPCATCEAHVALLVIPDFVPRRLALVA